MEAQENRYDCQCAKQPTYICEYYQYEETQEDKDDSQCNKQLYKENSRRFEEVSKLTIQHKKRLITSYLFGNFLSIEYLLMS